MKKSYEPFRSVSRRELRGEELDMECIRAKLATKECGVDDYRRFCYGLNDASTDSLIDKCINCGAHVSKSTCEVDQSE